VAAARDSPGHRATAHRQDHGQGHRSGVPLARVRLWPSFVRRSPRPNQPV